MKYRKLRIAWSVGCGILCVLLVVLWVATSGPNPYYVGRFQTHMNGGLGIKSFDGRLGIYSWDQRANRWNSFTEDWRSKINGRSEADGILGFAVSRSWAYGVILPYWFLFILTAVAGWLPWKRWRFGLRTLLIGMTVVALVLGAVIYAVR